MQSVGLDKYLFEYIIWINTGLLFFGQVGTNFSEIWIKMQQFSYKKIWNVVGHFVSASMSQKPHI